MDGYISDNYIVGSLLLLGWDGCVDLGCGGLSYSYLISVKPIKLFMSYINNKLSGIETLPGECVEHINSHTLFFIVSF